MYDKCNTNEDFNKNGVSFIINDKIVFLTLMFSLLTSINLVVP